MATDAHAPFPPAEKIDRLRASAIDLMDALHVSCVDGSGDATCRRSRQESYGNRICGIRRTLQQNSRPWQIGRDR